MLQAQLRSIYPRALGSGGPYLRGIVGSGCRVLGRVSWCFGKGEIGLAYRSTRPISCFAGPS